MSAVCLTVLLFGPQAALAGARELRLPLDSGATVAQVRAALGAACPALAPSLPASRFAVNHAFAAETDPVAASDEIALIGMVSGG